MNRKYDMLDYLRKSIFSGMLFLCLMSLSLAQFPEFKMYKIGDTGDDLLAQTSLADIDNDGDLDWVVGSGMGTIWWFEYQAADQWIKHVLGEGAVTDEGGVAFDVDGDGWIDQVSGQTWFKNPGDPAGKMFERYENKAIIAYDNVAADINGDGKTDLVAMSEHDGLFWYDIHSKPGKKWKEYDIGEGVSGGIAPNGIADMDRDGDLDVVRSNAWFENEDGSGKKWVIHRTIDFGKNTGLYKHSLRSWVVDMDNDGDNDLVQTEMNVGNGRVAWFENKDKKAINWYEHMVDNNTQQDLHSLAVHDFDNDGDYDIFSGGSKNTEDLHKRCFIWENTDGEGTKWKRHQILVDHECHDAVAGDVDGDGDIDICAKPWKGTFNYYLRNMHVENSK